MAYLINFAFGETARGDQLLLSFCVFVSYQRLLFFFHNEMQISSPQQDKQ